MLTRYFIQDDRGEHGFWIWDAENNRFRPKSSGQYTTYAKRGNARRVMIQLVRWGHNLGKTSIESYTF
jgi:hypothetical protein